MRPWFPVTSYGLYTHALWQLPEPLKLINLFEDRQSTPERTLRWLPLCAKSYLGAVFSQLLSFSPLLNCLGQRRLIRLCIFLRHGGLNPIVSEAIPMDLWCFLFGVAPAPFCVASLFSLPAKRKFGRRFACRRCCRVSCFCVFFPWFASFIKPKGFILFAHFYTASLTVRSEP